LVLGALIWGHQCVSVALSWNGLANLRSLSSIRLPCVHTTCLACGRAFRMSACTRRGRDTPRTRSLQYAYCFAPRGRAARSADRLLVFHRLPPTTSASRCSCSCNRTSETHVIPRKTHNLVRFIGIFIPNSAKGYRSEEGRRREKMNEKSKKREIKRAGDRGHPHSVK